MNDFDFDVTGRERKMNMYKKGDLVFVRYIDGKSFKKRGRPAVIVSGDRHNATGGNVAVAYLTERPIGLAHDLHVPIESTGRPSFVVAETFNSVSKARILSGLGHLTPEEFAEVNKAVFRFLEL